MVEDAFLTAHIRKLRAELAALEAGVPRVFWHGHAHQLRRLQRSGRTRLVYQGSASQCLAWARRHINKHDGRLFIEDSHQPARVLRPKGPRPKAADMTVLPDARRRVVLQGAITGTIGSWVDVTPAAWNEDPDYPSADVNFGWNSVRVHPQQPAVFFAFSNYQGVWKSTDYGLTWAKVSVTAALDLGRCWEGVIAPDGSYLLTTQGSGPTTGVFKSTDGGVNWTGYDAGIDYYCFSIDASDAQHVVASRHENSADGAKLRESTNGGESWTDRGDMGIEHSGYIYLLNSTTILAIAADDDSAGQGTRLGTWGGSSWSWASVDTQQAWHGSHQIYTDPTSGYTYSGGGFGIRRAVSPWTSWAEVSTIDSGAIVGTPTTMYGAKSYASQSSYPPAQQHALRATPTTWVDDSGSTPGGMTNGPSRMAVSTDGAGGVVVVSANWLAGLWRYRES